MTKKAQAPVTEEAAVEEKKPRAAEKRVSWADENATESVARTTTMTADEMAVIELITSEILIGQCAEQTARAAASAARNMGIPDGWAEEVTARVKAEIEMRGGSEQKPLEEKAEEVRRKAEEKKRAKQEAQNKAKEEEEAKAEEARQKAEEEKRRTDEEKRAKLEAAEKAKKEKEAKAEEAKRKAAEEKKAKN